MIRSYVIRSSHISPSQKRSFNDLLPIWGIDNSEVNWSKLFPDARKYIVEIGFGMGEATKELALQHPDWGILGIEVHPPGVGKLLWWIEKLSIENIRIACWDAVDVCSNLIPSSSVDAIHIWFPDPWPKKKHHKRRLINPEFARILTSILKVGGIIHVATDWEHYADQILNTLNGDPGLVNRYASWAARPDYRPDTKFEVKGMKSNRIIRDIVFEKK